MFYCKNCKRPADNDKCPFCGAKKLAEAKENDTVYLVSKGSAFSGMLEEIFKENKIPYLKQGRFGAGMTGTLGVGFLREDYKFYVPFGALEKAKKLLKEFFSEE